MSVSVLSGQHKSMIHRIKGALGEEQRVSTMLKKSLGPKLRFITLIQCCVGAAVIAVSVLAAVVTSNGDMEITGEELTVVSPLETTVFTSDESQETASLQLTEETKTEEYMGEMGIAAYCSCGLCVRRSNGYITYSGQRPVQGITVAANLEIFEIGDQVRIGEQVYEVQDKLSSKAKESLRLYFDSHEAALDFGRTTFPVYRVLRKEVHEGTLLGEFDITGYCSCEVCCGDKEVYLTKSELIPRAGHTAAADPDILQMGAKVEIDGIVYTVEDTGESVKGNVIDLYFDTHEEAVRFGRQRKEVYLVQ